MSFISKIQSGYKDVAYHNKTHGADVCQTLYYYAYQCDLLTKLQLDDIEMFCLIIGAACHDFEHPGLNNSYLIETQHEYAIIYNDISVLENHHVAATFGILVNDKYNIFKTF